MSLIPVKINNRLSLNQFNLLITDKHENIVGIRNVQCLQGPIYLT
jgi:hypothetical protein